ncbi:hypothetical protein TrRE_jg7502 [Triparma retinervis]|uniref:50S ribosomal protein L19, chloroplastic n=1 Tax=Triparma retinervis TaxID=2557542 RepID=A0A9W7AL17_9STRA|nr:hypothetical protein TrRE_jg7502 [Triparma retinervis]
MSGLNLSSLSFPVGISEDGGQGSKDDDVSGGASADDVEIDKEAVEEEEEEETEGTEETEETEETEDAEVMAADDDTGVPSTRLKYKTPKKRASMLLSIIKKEQEEKSKAAKPKVFDVDFAVGDSVELEYASTVDTKTRTISKVRGVLLAVRNKGIATNIVIRDVVLDEVVEREIPLHSPLVLSLKVLTKNFVKGRQKKKIKRAKLYYLRDRPDAEVRVTGSGQ